MNHTIICTKTGTHKQLKASPLSSISRRRGRNAQFEIAVGVSRADGHIRDSPSCWAAEVDTIVSGNLVQHLMVAFRIKVDILQITIHPTDTAAPGERYSMLAIQYIVETFDKVVLM